MLLPIRFSSLALCASLLSISSAIKTADISSDTPENILVSEASASLQAGNVQDALTFFEAAIKKEPNNEMTYFKRGAAYLSLGKNSQAQSDFDKVLTIKPGFEAALLQRAKLKSRSGNWGAAEKDYLAAKKGDSQELADLKEAQASEKIAQDAEKAGDWEACVSHAGVAIMTAGLALELRKMRARCRFEKGEVAEGVSDLQHVLNMGTGSLEPHLQISAMTFYSLGEPDKGLSQIRKCLHSDPDSKQCMKLMKREKAIDRALKKVYQLMEKRQWNSASKLLIPMSDDQGLLQDIKDDFKSYSETGLIHPKSPEGLYNTLVETVCECYIAMNSLKKSIPYCDQTLSFNPTSLHGLISKGRRALEAENFEEAIRTLDEAKEHHGGNNQIENLLREAHTLLKRSKQKDYYKVLGVPRDADERDIKKAWRKLTIKYHPDKVGGTGITPEEAQKKMAEINEAYEVLKDPELRQRFDHGDDPNNPEQQQGHPFQGSPFGGGQQQFVFRQGGPQFKFQQGGGGGGGFPFGQGFPGF
ncbi:DnaJ-domain-containing protein [Aulographum hederae CBS 113979]|uniref:Tetratricopeptide repeat and J domain-containing co-chaperone DNJ1 n=1 Tax=Aulographum hederae CBS 113979 TaxID=1176131 RepID=A0A6G1H4Y9_9PEZI|nr:DnaJ-domain-containing protein [Aulographum hederae CBS 113979]